MLLRRLIAGPVAFAALLMIWTCLASGDEAANPEPVPSDFSKSARRDEFLRNLPVPIRVPGEFGRISAALLSADELVIEHPMLFAELVGAISDYAPVVAIVSGPEEMLNGREALEEAGISRTRVNFLVYKLNTMWLRDYGPIFMRRSDGTGSIIDTYYSARSSNGADRTEDDRFPWVLANLLGVNSSYVPIAMEGGNLLTNGQGIAVTSTELLKRNRFRNLSGDEFNRLLATYFNLRSLVIVDPLPNESTGHVDMFITFVGTSKVVVAQVDPKLYPETARVLDEAASQLAQETIDDVPISVTRIPLPPKKGNLWRSYTNVFFANGLLLMPSYADVDPELEAKAVETYRTLLPKWQVKPIPADDLVELGGFLHCLTIGVPHFIDASKLLEYAE